MEITLFLSQVWGPVILAIGVGMFSSRNFYIKIYKDLQNETLAVLCFGIIAMAVGIVHIMIHNSWNSLPEVLISFFGWGLFLKGAMFIVAHHFVDKAGDAWVDKKMLPVAAVLMLAVGVYLTWFAYFV
jgi:predicted MFS family arabinose efflux permease